MKFYYVSVGELAGTHQLKVYLDWIEDQGLRASIPMMAMNEKREVKTLIPFYHEEEAAYFKLTWG